MMDAVRILTTLRPFGCEGFQSVTYIDGPGNLLVTYWTGGDHCIALLTAEYQVVWNHSLANRDLEGVALGMKWQLENHEKLNLAPWGEEAKAVPGIFEMHAALTQSYIKAEARRRIAAGEHLPDRPEGETIEQLLARQPEDGEDIAWHRAIEYLGTLDATITQNNNTFRVWLWSSYVCKLEPYQGSLDLEQFQDAVKLVNEMRKRLREVS